MNQITYKITQLDAHHYSAFFYVNSQKYPIAMVILPQSYIETGKITTSLFLNSKNISHTKKNITKRLDSSFSDNHPDKDILNSLVDIFSQKISTNDYLYSDVVNYLNNLDSVPNYYKQIVCAGCAVLFSHQFKHNRTEAYNIYALKLSINSLTKSRNSEKFIDRKVEHLRKHISNPDRLELIKFFFGPSFPIDLLDQVINS